MATLQELERAYIDAELSGDEPTAQTLAAELERFRQQSQQSDFLKTVDTTTGAPFAARAEAGIKLTPEGVLGNLRARYGGENVRPIYDKEGAIENFAFREKKTDQFKLFDPEPTGVGSFLKDLPGDIADVSGAAVEMVPNIAMAVLAKKAGVTGAAGKTAAQTGADVVGPALRYGVSKAFPGEEKLGPEELAKLSAFNVASGLVGEAGARGLGAVWSKVSPWRIPEKAQRLMLLLEKEATLPTPAATAAKEGAAKAPRSSFEVARQNVGVFEEAGIPATVGQLSGSPTQIRFENMLRQVPSAEGIWKQADLNRLAANGRYLDRMLEKVGPAVGADAAGNSVAAVGEAFIKGLVDKRSEAAGAFFNLADSVSGGERSILMAKTAAAIRQLVKEHKRVLGTDTNDRVAANLGAKLEKLIKESGSTADDIRVSAAELQGELHSFGLAAQSKGTVIEGIDRAYDKRIARKIFAALREDLDAAADVAPGSAGAYLKRARQIYAESSKVIDEAADALIEKATGLSLKERPDKLAESLLGSSFSDEQVRASIKRLEKMPGGKEAARNIRRAALDSLIGGAKPQASGDVGISISTALARGEDVGTVVSPAKLASALADKRKRLRALFVDDPEAVMALDKLGLIQAKLGATGGMAGSQTGAFGMFKDIISSLSRAEAGEAARTFSTLLAARNLSHVFNNPAQRNIFLRIVNPKIDWTPKNLSRAIGKLSLMNERSMLADPQGTTTTENELPPQGHPPALREP